jgi:hypothetical protein
MSSRRALAFGIALCFLAVVASGGQVVEIRDLRNAAQQPLVFPNAEIKVVAFQFESATADSRGRAEVEALHRIFLSSISDVSGAAIVTFVLPKDHATTSYRDTIRTTAREQHAQLAVWGSVLTDAQGKSRTNVHLLLLERPPGVRTDYEIVTPRPAHAPIVTRGLIDAPVTLDRIDFATLSGDVTPAARFLAALVRYYKGTTDAGSDASHWLRDAIRDFDQYLATPSARSDASAAAQAQLYRARAAVRLATADTANAATWLTQARQAADNAAELNPYSAEAPTLQGLIASMQHRAYPDIATHLSTAARIAPLDATARLNSAVFTSAQARPTDALHQINQTTAIYALKGVRVPDAVNQFREALERETR